MKVKICIVSGSRADYGLFYPLLKTIGKERKFAVQIAVTGAHLSSLFGSTYREIQKDGFRIDKKVIMPLSKCAAGDIAKSISVGLAGFFSAFSELKPDLVILLGDRFETLSAAIAAFVSRIPIAHINGGEITEGAMDDAFRHSITKMSLLHFTSNEEYRRRVIQLGELPERVFTVGALGADNIRKLKLIPKKELEKELGFKFTGKIILTTFHPVTLENNSARIQFEELLKALDTFKHVKVIFTKPNADVGGSIIMRLIDDYVRKNCGRAESYASLGRMKYLSLIKYVDVVAGNSSSGIIEVPYFGKPTVNIGDRQKGRVKARSVIDCKPEREAIKRAIARALSDRFRILCRDTENPYGDGKAAERITRILKKEVSGIKNLKKRFYSIRMPKNV